MDNIALSACIDEMLSGDESVDRDAIRSRILEDNQSLITDSARYTEGVPDGYSNWKDAYNGARSAYVKSVMNRTAPSEPNGPDGPDPVITQEPEPIKIRDLFK